MLSQDEMLNKNQTCFLFLTFQMHTWIISSIDSIALKKSNLNKTFALLRISSSVVYFFPSFLTFSLQQNHLSEN